MRSGIGGLVTGLEVGGNIYIEVSRVAGGWLYEERSG
jgi:hypothetical protein